MDEEGLLRLNYDASKNNLSIMWNLFIAESLSFLALFEVFGKDKFLIFGWVIPGALFTLFYLIESWAKQYRCYKRLLDYLKHKKI